jgi:hypothetical protein
MESWPVEVDPVDLATLSASGSELLFVRRQVAMCRQTVLASFGRRSSSALDIQTALAFQMKKKML